MYVAVSIANYANDLVKHYGSFTYGSRSWIIEINKHDNPFKIAEAAGYGDFKGTSAIMLVG